MKSFLHHLICMAGKRAQQRLEQACNDSRAAQHRLLAELLGRNKSTLFGREHGFARIRTVDDYRARVPVRDYEGHRPYIERIMCGDARALTKDRPFMFNMTSGTTDVPKYIPWNASVDRAGRSLTQLWIHRCLRDHPRILDHHVLCIVSAAVEGSAGDIPYGSASGHIYRSVPFFVQRHYVLPYAVAEIKDFDARYFVALRLAMERRVSVASSANPSTLIRLAETGVKHGERLIHAIRDGVLGIELDGQPEIARQLARCLWPNPARADQLEKLLQHTGTLQPRDYWPDLALIGCWTGSSIGSRVGELVPHYGDVPVRDLGFIASEARMTIPVTDHSSVGILAVNTNFYEFIPETEIDNPQPNTLLCDELEVGKRYYIVLTTRGGLYRYDINDVVEVHGFHGQSPMISFVRKGRDLTSITGEKLHVNQCLSAMRAMGLRHEIGIHQFRFAADTENSQYQIFIELSHGTGPIGTELINSIDNALCDSNVEYAHKRKSRRLAAPILHVMRRGWAENEVRSAVARGRRDAEFKWRHLLPQPRQTDTYWVQTTIAAPVQT